jgi:hypothetical protein
MDESLPARQWAIGNGQLAMSMREFNAIALYKLFDDRNVVPFEQSERGGDDSTLQERVVRLTERITHRERDEQRPRRFERRGDFPQQRN